MHFLFLSLAVGCVLLLSRHTNLFSAWEMGRPDWEESMSWDPEGLDGLQAAWLVIPNTACPTPTPASPPKNEKSGL